MNRQLDETSQALLTAAHKLLSEVGPDALTVRRIATEAGMSTMNVYSRFGGKDGVIDELYADGYRRLIAAIEAVPASDRVADEILTVARTYRQFALDNPTYYGIMFRSAITGFEPSQESVDLALGGLSSFVERVRRGQDLKQLARFPGRDATESAAWLWATCHGLISLELDGVAHDHVSWPSIFEHGMQTALAGLHPGVTASTN
jgi:AcrR family transcriptional regulator